METFNSENREAWQGLGEFVAKDKPNVGKKVRVTGGRKHKGKEGKVLRHQKSKFASDRYQTSAQAALRDMMGRNGFCCLVEQDSGETFWIAAEHTEIA